ncbi:uncharacterized protein LOC143540582 [Bidens hawaiensis]|uniref:uncharacterized protein LOC143540582 n=1 Tax=Bidens hawaiensis TaxID=980011 RepID=UPI00404AB421
MALQEINLALLAKWWWRFKNEKDGMWRKIVWAIHHLDRSWSFIPAKVSIPGPWKYIVNINKELLKYGLDLSKRIGKEVVLGDGMDRLVWDFEDNEGFSVRSLIRDLDELKPHDENYVMEWNNWVPKKVGIHAWRVEMGCIPILLELLKRGIVVTKAVCPICEEELESTEHLVISCQFAQTLWSVISSRCKVSSIFAFSVKDLLDLHRFSYFPKRKAKAFNAVCLTTIWCIWRARNALVFEGKQININNVVGEIKALTFLWVKNRGKNRSLTWEEWRGFNFML